MPTVELEVGALGRARPVRRRHTAWCLVCVFIVLLRSSTNTHADVHMHNTRTHTIHTHTHTHTHTHLIHTQGCLMPMGVTSENVAEKYGVDRRTQDTFAVRTLCVCVRVHACARACVGVCGCVGAWHAHAHAHIHVLCSVDRRAQGVFRTLCLCAQTKLQC